MNPSPFDLPTLQGWMQSRLMGQAGEDPAVASIDAVIADSAQQTSLERLNVYRYAYQARLLECLREEYATLCQFLGTEVFDGLATAYLQSYPSQSYTLSDLGGRFPFFLQHLAGSSGDGNASAESGFMGQQFLIDLASLERLYAEVFDGPGLEGLPAISIDDLQAISPAEWATVRFEPAPCLRLVEFGYPVQEFITACRHGTEPPVPEARRTRLAVTRRLYVVRRIVLTEPQFRLLTLLAERISLAGALDQVAEQVANPDSFAHEIQGWFREWTAAGFFRAIVPEHASPASATSGDAGDR